MEQLHYTNARPTVHGRVFPSFEAIWQADDLQKVATPHPFTNTHEELIALFTEIPFSATSGWQPSPNVTPCHHQAFNLLGKPQSGDYVLRAAPGLYLAVARQTTNGWNVYLLCSDRVVMTIRMEELCAKLPNHLRQPTYKVRITRDPKSDETGDIIREEFEEIPWDTRIRLILAKNGGAIVQIEA